ncbi:hypothetical protein [Pseudomonas protegens]|uniref:ParA family protein n=1 Tax=Pseudomonas protegens TaxID=380021 RepID=UPI003CC84A6C
MKRVAVASNEGGVGKTTTSAGLASYPLRQDVSTARQRIGRKHKRDKEAVRLCQ